VIVPDFQLSLAIGKEGQNARLAARLSGWRVDIKSESQLAEEESGGGVEYAEGEWVEGPSGELVWQPAEGGDAISAAEAGYASPDLGATVGEGEAKPVLDPTSLGDKPTPPPAPPSPAAAAAAPTDEAPTAAPTDEPTEGPAAGVEEPTAPSTQTEAVGAPLATGEGEKEGTVS
jgi:N utilization substance protein A